MDQCVRTAWNWRKILFLLLHSHVCTCNRRERGGLGEPSFRDQRDRSGPLHPAPSVCTTLGGTERWGICPACFVFSFNANKTQNNQTPSFLLYPFGFYQSKYFTMSVNSPWPCATLVLGSRMSPGPWTCFPRSMCSLPSSAPARPAGGPLLPTHPQVASLKALSRLDRTACLPHSCGPLRTARWPPYFPMSPPPSQHLAKNGSSRNGRLSSAHAGRFTSFQMFTATCQN